MIFYVFYSNISLHDSFESAISENLEWLKFRKSSVGFTPKPSIQQPLDTPAVLHAAIGNLKIGCLYMKNIVLFSM